MIDLDLVMVEVVDEDGGVASGQEGRSTGAGTVKRWGLPSNYVRGKAVVFEVSEGSAGEDDEVKHYDTDGTCSSGSVWAHWSGIYANVFSFSLLLTLLTPDSTSYLGYNLNVNAIGWLSG
jgi:hypothetical protein